MKNVSCSEITPSSVWHYANFQMKPPSGDKNKDKAFHLHAPGRLVHIALFLWQQKSEAVSSRWHRGSWVSILAPAFSGQCRHLLLPLQPGSAAPRAAPGSVCSDGSASCHILEKECLSVSHMEVSETLFKG